MKTVDKVKGVFEAILNEDGSIRSVFIHIKLADMHDWVSEDENTHQIDIEESCWTFTTASGPSYFGGENNIYLQE